MSFGGLVSFVRAHTNHHNSLFGFCVCVFFFVVTNVVLTSVLKIYKNLRMKYRIRFSAHAQNWSRRVFIVQRDTRSVDTFRRCSFADCVFTFFVCTRFENPWKFTKGAAINSTAQFEPFDPFLSKGKNNNFLLWKHRQELAASMDISYKVKVETDLLPSEKEQ